jgi:hypothetical protein
VDFMRRVVLAAKPNRIRLGLQIETATSTHQERLRSPFHFPEYGAQPSREEAMADFKARWSQGIILRE